MLTSLIRFLKDGSGDNLIGYALVAALISITVVGSVEAMGTAASGSFSPGSSTASVDAEERVIGRTGKAVRPK